MLKFNMDEMLKAQPYALCLYIRFIALQFGGDDIYIFSSHQETGQCFTIKK